MLDTIINMDGGLLLWIQDNLRTVWLDPVMVGITTIGNKGLIWIAISAVLLISKKTRKIGIMCLVALIMSLLINNVLLKNLIVRPRPFTTMGALMPLIPLPFDFSFPSGHAASSFACACILYRKLPGKLGVPAIILAVLIAFSRLYVGVHYPTDVLAGVLSGVIISYMAQAVVNRLYK